MIERVNVRRAAGRRRPAFGARGRVSHGSRVIHSAGGSGDLLSGSENGTLAATANRRAGRGPRRASPRGESLACALRCSIGFLWGLVRRYAEHVGGGPDGVGSRRGA